MAVNIGINVLAESVCDIICCKDAARLMGIAKQRMQ